MNVCPRNCWVSSALINKNRYGSLSAYHWIGLGQIRLKTWSDVMFWLQLMQTEEVLPQVLPILFVPSTSTLSAYKRLLFTQLCLCSFFLIQFYQNYWFGFFFLNAFWISDIFFFFFFVRKLSFSLNGEIGKLRFLSQWDLPPTGPGVCHGFLSQIFPVSKAYFLSGIYILR